VDAADRGEIDERRAQHEPGGWVLGGELAHHTRAEALPEVQEAIGRQAGPGQEVQGGADVARQTGLRRATAIAAVAAIVEQQHRETVTRERRRERGSQRPVAGVSRRHQDAQAAARLGGRDEPGAERQPIDRPERHVPRTREHGDGRRYVAREREVDQASLEGPEEREDQRCERHDEDHRTEHPDRAGS
jgi:hypothetical protein